MLSAVIILLFTILVVFFIPNYSARQAAKRELAEQNSAPQVKKLWSLAQNAMKERKPVKAEKALLTILKFDEKNAAAYNRLGILYAREKHFDDAIDCFEIAQSLDNNASSLHNVGLIYLETNNYEKAAQAFEQAIALDGDQPGRYIAYAKALEKLGERKRAIAQLENAYSLNPSTVVLRHLLEIYENVEDFEGIENTKKRIEELSAIQAKNKAKASTKRGLRASAKTKTTAKSIAHADSRATRQKARAEKSAARSATRLAKQQAKDSARAKARAVKAQARATSAAKNAAKSGVTPRPTASAKTAKQPKSFKKLAKNRKVI